MKAVYFNTHATLTEYHAKLCFRALAEQSIDYKWDRFFIYNSHQNELSNETILELYNSYNLFKHFEKIEIIPYDASCKKTNFQDFINMINHCRENVPLRSGNFILYLKSEYILSHKFMDGLERFNHEENFIFSAMTENAKEFVKEEELFERASRDIFTLVDDVTFYAGTDFEDGHPLEGGPPRSNTVESFELKTHWNNSPLLLNGGFEKMKTGPAGVDKPYDPQVRFISHTARGDVNVHYMPSNVFINTSFKGSKHHSWGYWQGWNQAFLNQGVRALNIPESFCIHVYHGVISKNRREDRNDSDKVIEGQKY